MLKIVQKQAEMPKIAQKKSKTFKKTQFLYKACDQYKNKKSGIMSKTISFLHYIWIQK